MKMQSGFGLIISFLEVVGRDIHGNAILGHANNLPLQSPSASIQANKQKSSWISVILANLCNLQIIFNFFLGGRGVATGHLLRFGEQKTHVVVVIRATAPRNVTKLYGSWEDNQSIFLAHLGVAVLAGSNWLSWNAIQI